VIVVMTFGLLSTFMLTQLSNYFAFIFDQISRLN
jgi:flagellar biosynthesis protein FliQ